MTNAYEAQQYHNCLAQKRVLLHSDVVHKHVHRSGRVAAIWLCNTWTQHSTLEAHPRLLLARLQHLQAVQRERLAAVNTRCCLLLTGAW